MSSSDELSKTLVGTMQAIFKKHPGYRTTHAKGILLDGVFTPSANAKGMSVAPHFNNASTPITARFSVGGGFPQINDTNASANPKGIAVRFLVDEKTHTDIICHSFYAFPVRTGEDFLQFLRLSIAKAMQKEGAVENFDKFLQEHPSALAFAKAPNPNPVSYGSLTYFGVNTHIFTNAAGAKTNMRYRIIPPDGDNLLGPDDVKNAKFSYLEDELVARLPSNPILLNLYAQVALPEDILDDATIPYSSDEFVLLGQIKLDKVSDENAVKQKEIMFSPVPNGVDGIEPSKDPLIQARHGVYWESGSQRRAETQTEPSFFPPV